MKEYFTTLIEGFKAQPAYAWAAIGGLIVLGAILIFLRKQKFSARVLAVGAISVAIAFVLSCITLYKMPNGGSITPASMLPIIAFAWTFGTPAGLIAGIAYGMLQIIQGAYIIHPVQFLFDYILPFALLGFAGLFKGKRLLMAILFVAALRFLSHYLSGAIFFGMYAPEGQSPWAYSFLYNITYMLPETVVVMVVAAIPAMRRFIEGLSHSQING